MTSGKVSSIMFLRVMKSRGLLRVPRMRLTPMNTNTRWCFLSTSSKSCRWALCRLGSWKRPTMAAVAVSVSWMVFMSTFLLPRG